MAKDDEVIISVKVATQEAVKGANKITSEIKKLTQQSEAMTGAQKIAVREMVNTFQALMSNYVKARKNVEDLKRDLSDPKYLNALSKEKLKADITEAERELQSARDKLASQFGKILNSDQAKALTEPLKMAVGEVNLELNKVYQREMSMLRQFEAKAVKAKDALEKEKEESFNSQLRVNKYVSGGDGNGSASGGVTAQPVSPKKNAPVIDRDKEEKERKRKFLQDHQAMAKIIEKESALFAKQFGQEMDASDAFEKKIQSIDNLKESEKIAVTAQINQYRDLAVEADKAAENLVEAKKKLSDVENNFVQNHETDRNKLEDNKEYQSAVKDLEKAGNTYAAAQEKMGNARSKAEIAVAKAIETSGERIEAAKKNAEKERAREIAAEEKLRKEEEKEAEKRRADEAKRLAEEEAYQNEQREQWEATMGRFKDGLGQVGSAAKGFVATAVKKPFQLFMTGAQKGIGMMKSFVAHSKRAVTSSQGMAKAFTSLKRILISRVKNRLITQIVSGVREAMSKLALFDKDYNRAMTNITNSSKELGAGISVTLGNLIKLIEPIVTTIINAFSQLFAYINGFFAMLNGKSTFLQAKKQTKSYADSIKEASGAMSQLNAMVYGFDQLNKRDKPNNSGNGDLFEEVSTEGALPDWLKDWYQRLIDAIKLEDWYKLGVTIGEGFTVAFEYVDNWIQNEARPFIHKWAKNIALILRGVVDGLDWDTVGKTFADGMNAVIDGIYMFLVTFNLGNFGKAISEMIMGWFENVDWELLGKTIGTFIQGKFNFLSELFNGLDYKEIGESIYQLISSGIQSLNIKRLVQGVATLIKGIFTDVIPNVLPAIGEFAEEIFGALFGSEVGSKVKSAFDGVFGAITNFIDNYGDHFAEIFNNVFKIFSDLAENILPALGPLFEGLLSILGPVIEGIATIFGFLGEYVLKPLFELLGDVGEEAGISMKALGDSISYTVDQINKLDPEKILHMNALDVLGIFAPKQEENFQNRYDKFGEEASGIKEITSAYTEEAKAIAASNDELQKRVEVMSKNAGKQSQAIKNIQNEYAGYETLLGELKSIVDENGKVRKGYEERANTITTILGNAFGVEFIWNDNIIQDYQSITKEIYNTIAAMKAEAALRAGEEAYVNALKNRIEYATTLKEAQDEMTKAEKLYNDELAKYNLLMAAADAQGDERLELLNKLGISEDELTGALTDSYTALGIYSQHMADAKESMDEAGRAIEMNESFLQNYDELMAAVASGSVERMNEAVDKLASNFLTAENSSEESLERQYKAWDEAYKAIIKKSKDSGVELDASVKEYYERMVNASKTELDKFKGTHNETLNKIIEQYNLNASTIFAKAKDLGKFLAQGLANGTNENAHLVATAATNMANSVITNMKNRLQIKSPSRATAWIGEMIDRGLGRGIDRNAGIVEKSATELAEDTLGYLEGSMEDVSAGGDFMVDGLDAVADRLAYIAESFTKITSAFANIGEIPFVASGAFVPARSGSSFVADSSVNGIGQFSNNFDEYMYDNNDLLRQAVNLMKTMKLVVDSDALQKGVATANRDAERSYGFGIA